MKKENQNGFTLVLSLVLLLVMSLMGGSLIVISSGDHQSNNTSDQYQQTFYVAEHALMEAEKRISNRMLGPWMQLSDFSGQTFTEATEQTAHNNYVATFTDAGYTPDSFVRHTEGRDIPRNLVTPTLSPCFNSFRNLIREQDYFYTSQELDALTDEQRTDLGDPQIGDFRERDTILVTDHFVNLNFGDVIAPILADGLTVGLTNEEAAEEQEYLRRFRYEFFSINAGSAIFKGTGTSIKKTATNTQRQGTAYRIYGCGYLMPSGAADNEFADPDILIPLESLVILSS